MNFFAYRGMRKQAKHYLHEARHARAMREDVAPPADLERLDRAMDALRAARTERDRAAFDAAARELGEAAGCVYPPKSHPALRENLEIAAVALAVAMGFRTYFVQPFKIPTGSMQPTLHGVIVHPQEHRTWRDYPPMNIVRWALFGEGFVEVKAKRAGTVDPYFRQTEDGYLLYVDGTPQSIRRGMPRYVDPGDFVTRGQVIASGRVRLGDHVFVNKVRYNFARPHRGDVIVFDTDEIKHPQIRKHSFYIKRLAGLPNETISIDPPYLVADGKRVEEPYPFRRLLTDTAHGYQGYQLAMANVRPPARLATRSERVRLGPDQFLPLGDNTASSLDGRYFGPVPRESLVGPAFMVYWPLSPRWGLVH